MLLYPSIAVKFRSFLGKPILYYVLCKLLSQNYKKNSNLQKLLQFSLIMTQKILGVFFSTPELIHTFTLLLLKVFIEYFQIEILRSKMIQRCEPKMFSKTQDFD